MGRSDRLSKRQNRLELWRGGGTEGLGGTGLLRRSCGGGGCGGRGCGRDAEEEAVGGMWGTLAGLIALRMLVSGRKIRGVSKIGTPLVLKSLKRDLS